MADIQANQFGEFFYELHGKTPFPWQEALAAQVCANGWSEVKVIDLPTASGKTACIDVALFALAVRPDISPRRIFFVVDRRIVVNEAYLRMRKLQCKLTKALVEKENYVLRAVAEKFRQLSRGKQLLEESNTDRRLIEEYLHTAEDCDRPPEGWDVDHPLFVYEMRGGAFRDETWVQNPLQPTVIASTVDQVGSRLLFRGYGVSQNSWPLHAGLISNDALIFLDEAHCSLAFAQTLKRVESYRSAKWASHPISTSFHFVEMTATPSLPDPGHTFQLTDNDRGMDVLKKRLQAAKPTRLIEVKVKKDDTAKLVDALIEQAEELAKAANAKRVAIFANRVKTAKQAYKSLRQRMKGTTAQVELLIGSMRAVDRDDLYAQKLRHLKSGEERKPDVPLTFVVSTQCLEVGADLDFDVLVSECGSVDALQQRFGRLDRLGNFGSAQGAIVIGSWQMDPKQPDPVYRTALSETWKWLKELAGESDTVNMGIESREGEPPTIQESLGALDSGEARKLRFQGEDAPILLPAHIDMLAQTSPEPKPSPLVELFLHGPKRGDADVQIVWRSDLEDVRSEKEEIEIVRLCPPSSRETMSVSISAFRKWFAGEKNIYESESDLESGVEEDDEPVQRREVYALVLNGDESERVRYAKQIRPGQTLILKESAGGWNELGHIPEWAAIDLGDLAAFPVRSSISLRLHPKIMNKWPETQAFQSLVKYLSQPSAELKDIERYLKAYLEELETEPEDGKKSWPYEFLSKLNSGELRRLQCNSYPGQDVPYVLRAFEGKAKQSSGGQVFLKDHLEDVERAVLVTASSLENDFQTALAVSAAFHDYGKADIRFQALLRGGDHMAARYALHPLAKSGNEVVLKQQDVGLPEGFRHELLSLMFAEKSPAVSGPMRDLILHLIATHHGRCRPFAPVVLDDNPECVSYRGVSLCKAERIENAPHRLDRGVADRFWKLTEKHGWWGLAYLEALLRLADWQASKDDAAEGSND